MVECDVATLQVEGECFAGSVCRYRMARQCLAATRDILFRCEPQIRVIVPQCSVVRQTDMNLLSRTKREEGLPVQKTLQYLNTERNTINRMK